jgi:hypothetical protein
VPLGLLEPQSAVERQQVEQHSEIVLKAMINAAKAAGQTTKVKCNASWASFRKAEWARRPNSTS